MSDPIIPTASDPAVTPVKPAEPAPAVDKPIVSGDVKPAGEPTIEPKTVPLSELLEARKLLKVFQDEKTAAEKKQLEEQGKWQELAQQNEAKATAAEARARDAQIQNSVILEASKLGIVDPDAASKLINRTNIQVDDNGNVTGVDEALKQLIVDKPYFVSKDTNTRIGSGSNPAPGEGSPTTTSFKKSQLRDPKFYQANKVEILKAIKLGQVEDDTQR